MFYTIDIRYDENYKKKPSLWPFGLLASRYLIWLSILLTMSVHDEGYCWVVTSALGYHLHSSQGFVTDIHV